MRARIEYNVFITHIGILDYRLTFGLCRIHLSRFLFGLS